MSDIYNTKLLDLIPPNLRSDPDIIAASQAVDREFTALVNSIKNVLTFANVDGATSDVVDNLASELRVAFYDSTLDLTTRRELVKNALLYNMIKGTPAVIENLATTLFGDAQVEEWFDYGGQPYHFRVLTVNSAVTNELADQFNDAVNAVKNLRSVLEAVIVIMSGEMNMYFGNVLHTGDNITIEQVV